MKDYSAAIKNHRTIRNKTLLDVSKETGISVANLSRWESGKVQPNVIFCVKLADYYNISIDELLGRKV